jgi:hypothetical protein
MRHLTLLFAPGFRSRRPEDRDYRDVREVETILDSAAQPKRYFLEIAVATLLAAGLAWALLWLFS